MKVENCNCTVSSQGMRNTATCMLIFPPLDGTRDKRLNTYCTAQQEWRALRYSIHSGVYSWCHLVAEM